MAWCIDAENILTGPGRQKQLKLCTVQQIKYNLDIKIFCLVSVQLKIFPAFVTLRSTALASRKELCSVSELLLEALAELKRGRKDIKAFKGMHHCPDWEHKISTSALRFTLYINIEP